MTLHGHFRLAAWPHLVAIACVLLVMGCQDGSGPSLVTSPEGKPAYEGAKPPPPAPADPAIAFHTMHGTQGSDLKVMNADGSNVATIYHTPYSSIMAPSWSPDGGSIAFSQYRGPGNQGQDLMIIDVSVVNGVPTGSNLRVLLDRMSSLWYPAWSPLGDKIASAR